MIGGAPAGAPFSIYMGERMPKPFMTYEQQIQKFRDKNQYVVRRDFIAVVLAFRYLLPVISKFPVITYLVFFTAQTARNTISNEMHDHNIFILVFVYDLKS